MPIVPRLDAPTVGVSQQPVTPVRAPDMPDVAGSQLQQGSQAFMRAGDVAGRIAIDMQTEANQLRVDDAVNQAKEAAMRMTYDKQAGFMSQTGLAALQRSSGKPLADEYSDNLRDQLSQISDGLGNDQQKMLFKMRSNDLLTSFRTQAIQHEASQFKEYALSVREGTIRNSMNSIGLNYNNPEMINQSISSIKAAVYSQAQILGKSAEWTEAQTRKFTSDAHKLALSAALEKNDLGYAQQYLKVYAKDMNAEDILRIQGMVTKEIDQRIAVTTASVAMQKAAPQISTNDADRAFNILIGAESRGQQLDKTGAPLTSKAGAVGIAQVMPETGKAMAAAIGVKWDEEKFKTDPEYNRALGKAYFQRQLQDFGGNLAQAYAAYNAGPKWVKEAVDRAAAAKPGTQEADWFWQLNNDKRTAENRAETQKYVTGNLAAYANGSGQYQRPTLQDIHNNVRVMLGADAPPNRVRAALDEASRQYEDMLKGIKQREDEGVANAMRAVMQNGGRFSDLPITVRNAIPPKEVDNVMNFASRIAKGDDVTNMALYQKLATDQKFLRNLSDNEFFRLRSELSESDFKKFADERQQLLTGQRGTPEQDLNTSAINTVLNDRLRTLGIDPTPKDDGGKDAMRVGAIRKFVRDAILTQQGVAGKKFTDAEVERQIDSLFAKSQEFRSTFLGIGTTKTSQRLLTMTTSDIPTDIADKLKKDFKDMGVEKPTDADLLGAYWKLKFAKK